MNNIKHCGNCSFLSITEEQQDQIRVTRKLKHKESKHWCTKHDKRICHYHHHPLLPRLEECVEDYPPPFYYKKDTPTSSLENNFFLDILSEKF